MSDQRTNGSASTAADDAPLLAEFETPSYEAWHAATLESLKGATFARLFTKTYEGIELQPIYRREDTEAIAHQHTLPGQPPFVRGIDATGYLVAPWAIAQEIAAATPAAFNAALTDDLARGQTAINLVTDAATQTGLDPDQAAVGEVGRGGVSIADLADFAEALADADLAAMPVIISGGAAALPLTALLVAAAARHGVSADRLHGWVDNDPLGVLATTGTLPAPLTTYYDEMAALTTWAEANASPFGTVSVRGDRYQDVGADAVQELALSLAAGVAYVAALQDRGVGIDTAAARVRFVFGVGAQFFMEVAKLRAARLLWSQVVAAFGGGAAAQRMQIHARTASWNKTAVDPYVNMLRATTEAFAGAVGGIQSLHVTPFDAAVRTPDEFARRMARNTQIILQEECSLTRLIDPAGGAWYVEWLTDQVAARAWARFQAIEGAGGLLAALQAGTVQQEIAAVAQQRVANVARRKDVLVGMNMYPNLQETPLAANTVDAAAPQAARAAAIQGRRQDGLAAEVTAGSGAETVSAAIAAAAAGATLGQLTGALRSAAGQPVSVAALAPLRVAAAIEELRGRAWAYAARTGEMPQVMLATMGPLKQHKARADFVQGFLAVGGFECVYPDGFETAEAAAAAALAYGAPAVVICSTDETYPELVPAIAQRIKEAQPSMLVLLAGYPTDQVEAFKAAGVDEFIHLRADCHALNRWLQGRIGMDDLRPVAGTLEKAE